MIHGFKGNKTTTAEEWLIDYSLRTGNVVGVNTDLFEMPIKFDGREVDAFILDVLGNKLVIQLSLLMVTKFDDNSNRYGTSYVRELITSKEFLNRFNPEFAKHVQQTKVRTEDYVTNDKFWLLSHEEVINREVNFLKPNHECHIFEMFKTIDLDAYSQMLLKYKTHEYKTHGWRLRSAYSSVSGRLDSGIVGYVSSYGIVNVYLANNTEFGALMPACTIC